MYMWFSSHIIVLELVSSIHFNLLNLSSKKIVYLQLSSKKFIYVQFSSILCLSSMYTWKNIFHVIFTWHTNIFKIFYRCHQNIPNISILAYTFMFTCSHSHSCVRFIALLPPSTLKHINFETISSYFKSLCVIKEFMIIIKLGYQHRIHKTLVAHSIQ
jgi:hypothetical protein